jgi:hypothetical protein
VPWWKNDGGASCYGQWSRYTYIACGWQHIWMNIVHYLIKMEVVYLCGITDMKMAWNAQGKNIFVGYFTGQTFSGEVLE